MKTAEQPQRYRNNPLLAPEMVIPSEEGLAVIGVFNCAAIRFRGEILLICRVAETAESGDGTVSVPIVGTRSEGSRIEIESYALDAPLFDFSDSRAIRRRGGCIHRLTSLSHFRLARSSDGKHFTIDPAPWIFPEGRDEEWGIEDPRVTEIDGMYYITYSAVSADGVAVGLITTTDFISYHREGIILPPTNKDAAIFPEKIGGRYCMMHRPVPSDIGSLNIWISWSDNLRDWGTHRCLTRPEREWETDRMGVGAVPVMTDKGWLVLYHAADSEGVYSAGLLLIDASDPSVVLARTVDPFFRPEYPYETSGFYGNVVFPCGVLADENNLLIYYGAADDTVCLIESSWTAVWEALGV